MSLPVRSVPPTDGAAAGAPWTGEKRRKTLGSLSSDDAPEVTPMDIGPQVQEEQGAGQESDEFVFSAEDDLGYEEVQSYCEELLRRECLEDPDFLHQRHRCGSAMQEKLYQRLCELRWKDYKILVGDGVINPGDTALNKLEDCPWDNPFEPGPSLFGWTYDPEHFDIEQLDDYQRILPTRVDSFEYYNWDEYRLTFSNYETDQEYVKYCDKISKKMKWVEECMCRDYIKFVRKLNYRAQKQTMKIATMKDFSHLTYSLAKRGYAEYIWDLRYHIDTKDYINVFFELWKRVYKQEMSFEDALKLELPKATFYTSTGSRVEDQLKGNNNLMHDEFERCMPIPSHVVEDDEALQHITDAVYKIKSDERRKSYLDFVKKKIEVAQRLQLFPASRVGTERPKGSESSVCSSNSGCLVAK